MRVVFEVLANARLTFNLNKCRFGCPEVTFLGYQLNSRGFKPPAAKVDAIVDYPRPDTIMDLRRFLGMINYYRALIPEAAEMQAPLTDLLRGAKKKDRRKIDWTPERINAFSQCKESLTLVTQASFLEPDAPLALTSDASSTALGASLEQLEDDIWRPLGFFSRKLSPAESKYSPYDRELLGAFAALKHFEHLLEGRQFILRTDQLPLTKALEQRPEKASPRQLRQLDYIGQFCINFEYIRGDDNVVADALSRVESIDMPSIMSPAAIHEAQDREDIDADHELATSSLNLQPLTIDGHRLMCETSTGVVRPYIPHELRKTAFNVVHSPAHPSGRTTTRMLKEKYVWPGIKKDSLKWARECLLCQRAKIHRHARVPPTNIDVPDQRFSHVHLDIIVMPLLDGYRYCLTMIDRFSRWPNAIPLKDIQAETIASNFYSGWIATFGTPLTITTDQGTQFESALFTALARIIGAEKIRTTPYHPQSNGMLERWHRTLKAALMCYPSIPWLERLPTVLLGLRTAYKEDLKASPAQLMFGTTLRIPGDFFTTQECPADISSFTGKLQDHFRTMKPLQTDHHVRARPFIHKDLATCTHVFRKVNAVKPPLTPPYTGPHRVLRRLDQQRVVIDVDGAPRTVSTADLKPAYIARDEPSIPMDQPSQRQPRRSVSFQEPQDHQPSTSCPPQSSATRGGVAVAPECLPPSNVDPPLPPGGRQQHRRKQLLEPRALF